MSMYTLPHFGQIDLTKLEECYDVTIEFNGGETEIDLNFEQKTIDTYRLDIVKGFLDNLSDFDKKNKEYINQDFADDNCDTVKTYVEFCIQELGENELADVVDLTNKSIDPEVQLINALRLVRIGFFPDERNHFVTFDYSISRDLTDDLVVIFTDENGKMDYMTMES